MHKSCVKIIGCANLLQYSKMNNTRDKLRKLLKQSYSPYSKVQVAAVLILDDGKEFSGVNIENAALSPSLCAERGAIFQAVFKHGPKLRVQSMHIMTSLPTQVFPCGVCLQMMCEFFDPATKIFLYKPNDAKILVKKLVELIPHPVRANFF